MVPGIIRVLIKIMAILTNISLFIGPINIDISSKGVEFEIQEYCERLEAELLEKLLGRTLYTEYLDDSTDIKFTELLDGVTDSFEYGGITRKYTGLANKFCYYIYYLYSKDQYATNTAHGDVAPESIGGSYQYNEGRVIRAYNKWIDAFNDAVDFIRYKNELTPDTYVGFTTSKMIYANTFGI